MQVEGKKIEIFQVEHDNNSKKVSTPAEPFKFAGYLGTIVAAFSCSLGILCFKLLPVEDTLQEKAKACMIRGLFIMLFSGLTICYRGVGFKIARGEYLVNLIRSLVGSFELFLTYVALKYISMGECTAITYLSAIWTCMLASILLAEAFKFSILLVLPVSLFGMALLAKPDLIFGLHGEKLKEVAEELDADLFESRWPGIAAALAVSLLMALVTISFKFQHKTPIVTCTFYLGLAMVVLSVALQSLAVGFGPMPSSALEYGLHLCIGLVSYWTQFLFQWALKFVPVSTFSVIRTLDIAIAFAMSALFLSDPMIWTSIAGSLLIMLVMAILLLDESLLKGLKRMCCSVD